MVFTVSDNGRGIPISIHPEKKIPQATLALSEPFSGRNFNDATRGASRGTNGVGAAMVNFCSEWFKLDITRDKKAFHQTFSEGEKALKIEEPLILPAPPKATTGTKISWKLSKKVFKDFTLPEQFIRDRVFEIALCYPRSSKSSTTASR
jgi:DNA gyrase subunit B